MWNRIYKTSYICLTHIISKKPWRFSTDSTDFYTRHSGPTKLNASVYMPYRVPFKRSNVCIFSYEYLHVNFIINNILTTYLPTENRMYPPPCGLHDFTAYFPYFSPVSSSSHCKMTPHCFISSQKSYKAWRSLK